MAKGPYQPTNQPTNQYCLFGEKYYIRINTLIRKDSSNSDGKQFYQYKQMEQPPPASNI
jgi:hypothetical protein